MKKISIGNVVEFSRKKTESSRITLINSLKKDRSSDQNDNSGNYWIHSLSAISSVFRTNKNEALVDKINVLNDKIDASTAKISKNMFSRNIDILHNFEDVDFSDFKPKYALNYLTKPQDKSILTIKGVPIQVLPTHVFTFKENNVDKVGAVWFVAKLNGYSMNELGMFTDALYRYLKTNYSKNFEISVDYCNAIDVVSRDEVNYSKITNKSVRSDLSMTLEAIGRILK